jgi:hypothetical protein
VALAAFNVGAGIIPAQRYPTANPHTGSERIIRNEPDTKL